MKLNNQINLARLKIKLAHTIRVFLHQMRQNRQLAHEKEATRGGQGFDSRSQQSFFEYSALVGKLMPQPLVVASENTELRVTQENLETGREKGVDTWCNLRKAHPPVIAHWTAPPA